MMPIRFLGELRCLAQVLFLPAGVLGMSLLGGFAPAAATQSYGSQIELVAGQVYGESWTDWTSTADTLTLKYVGVSDRLTGNGGKFMAGPYVGRKVGVLQAPGTGVVTSAGPLIYNAKSCPAPKQFVVRGIHTYVWAGFGTLTFFSDSWNS